MRRSILFLVLCLVATPAWAGHRDVVKAQKLIDAKNYDGAVAYVNAAIKKKQDFDSLVELRGLLDDALYGRAEAAASAAAYHAYLASAPKGAHRNDAAAHLCDLDWVDAKSAAGESNPAPLLAFQRVDADCPQSEKAGIEARGIAFSSARAQGTSQAIRDFLREWPGAENAEIPRSLEDDLAFKEAEASAGEKGLQDYALTHPKGEHLPQALAEAESRAWDGASSSQDSAALAAFLVSYPESSHVAEAEASLKKVAHGLFRLEGDNWTPLDSRVWIPGALVYKPAAGEAAPTTLQIWGIHGTLAGDQASPVAFPLGSWAAGLLGLDPSALEHPSIRASSPGTSGEYTFAFPFLLPSWTFRHVTLVAYELRVLDAQGKVLSAVRVAPGAQDMNLEDFLQSGPVAARVAAGHAADPWIGLALAALQVQDGNYPEAVRAWGAARAAWPSLPASAPGLIPSNHSGAVYVSRADRERAPGSQGAGFVPLFSAVVGRFILMAPSSASGTLFLDDGHALGSARLTGRASGTPWFTQRGAFTGALTLSKNASSTSVFGHEVFLVSSQSMRHLDTPTLQDFLTRWPSLQATVQGPPATWVQGTLAQAGVQRATGPYALTADGLPSYLGFVDGRAVLARILGDGRVVVERSAVTIGDSGAHLQVLAGPSDVDGDGRPELIATFPGDCNGLDVLVVREAKARVYVDDVNFESVCDGD